MSTSTVSAPTKRKFSDPFFKEFWHAQDGRVLRLSDMETDHLEKCIAMLRRKGYVARSEHVLPLPPMNVNGEYAQLALDQHWEAECEDFFTKRPHPSIDPMQRELARRTTRAQ